MTTPEAALHRLVSSSVWQPNWSDVLTRAGEVPAKQPRLVRRRLVLTAALVAAIVAPLTALSAANDWWFFKVAGAP
jgi:predicted nicotinamide N-methyase